MTHAMPNRTQTREFGGLCGRLALAALFFLGVSCGGPQGKVVQKGLETMSDEQRASTFDKMAAALDRDPKLVDELYVVARRHPPMFHRFLANATTDLADRKLAKRTAKLLVERPASLEQMLLATLDQTQEDPKAHEVLARAIASRRAIVADVLTDYPEVMRATMNATLYDAQQKRGARDALLTSMRQSSDRVADVLVEDPETLSVLMGAMVKEGLDRDTIKKMLAGPSD